MNPFSINSPVIQFLAKVGDLIILNILTLILSLPIVTIGAATTALHYAVDKVFTDEGTLLKNYFHAFKIKFQTVHDLLAAAFGAVGKLPGGAFLHGGQCLQRRYPGAVLRLPAGVLLCVCVGVPVAGCVQ